MSVREFPTAVVASLSSGVALCNFSDIHEAAEYLMGYPIWTHQFASKALRKKMQRAVLAQCPGLPTKLEGVNKENYAVYLAEIEERVGPTCTIHGGVAE